MISAPSIPSTHSLRPEVVRRGDKPLSRTEYERYLPLVRRTGMRMARRVPSTVTLTDLINYGWIGFLEAYRRVHTFSSHEEFEAFALYRVRGAMLDHLRSLDPATRAARRASRAVARATARASQTAGRVPTEDEIASQLGVSVDAYRHTLTEIAHSGMNRIELLAVECLEGSAEPQFESHAERSALRSQLASAIGKLPERLQQVLALYYQEDLSLRDVGAVLGVSESRACQLHTEAVHRLRAALGME